MLQVKIYTAFLEQKEMFKLSNKAKVLRSIFCGQWMGRTRRILAW